MPASTDALVEMRLNNENERFREHLSNPTSVLSEVSLSDLDRVLSEVSKGIGGLLNEHRSEARKIVEKYKAQYIDLAAKGRFSVGALFVPHLAPRIAAVPGLTFGGAYAKTKVEELREKPELSASLIGIFDGRKEFARPKRMKSAPFIEAQYGRRSFANDGLR